MKNAKQVVSCSERRLYAIAALHVVFNMYGMIHMEWESLAFFARGAPILSHLLRSSELAVVNHSSMVCTTAGNSLRLVVAANSARE